MAELYQLQEQEIPAAMAELAQSHANLKKVADYCDGLYLQAADSEKRPALEETRGYTTQALASVAYQINTLATSFLSLLDLQVNQLTEMESSINHLAQNVAIHKEKVARREIGVLTTNKSFFRPVGVKTPGIIFPEQPEKPLKYVRKPVDFSILDGVGHGGVKQSSGQRSNRTLSVTSSNSSYAPSNHSAQLPQTNNTGTGTVPRGVHYRQGLNLRPGPAAAAPAAVAAPTVPSHYMSAEQLMLAQQSGAQMNVANALYSHGQMGTAPPPPPLVVNTPEANNGINGYPMPGGPASPPPPPPLPAQPQPQTQQDDAILNQAIHHQYMGQQTLPPPPPPEPEEEEVDHSYIDRDSFIPPPPPVADSAAYNGGTDHRQQEPAWAPETYLEKVVAIYDYEPVNDDELRFRENAVIYVIKKNSDGWWEGVMEADGGPVCGLFPENYVEPLY